ncbi:hypothetical protein D037_0243A, partial [Vibrio parahaemolyticus IDH02640]
MFTKQANRPDCLLASFLPILSISLESAFR